MISSMGLIFKYLHWFLHMLQRNRPFSFIGVIHYKRKPSQFWKYVGVGHLQDILNFAIWLKLLPKCSFHDSIYKAFFFFFGDQWTIFFHEIKWTPICFGSFCGKIWILSLEDFGVWFIDLVQIGFNYCWLKGFLWHTIVLIQAEIMALRQLKIHHPDAFVTEVGYYHCLYNCSCSKGWLEFLLFHFISDQ